MQYKAALMGCGQVLHMQISGLSVASLNLGTKFLSASARSQCFNQSVFQSARSQCAFYETKASSDKLNGLLLEGRVHWLALIHLDSKTLPGKRFTVVLGIKWCSFQTYHIKQKDLRCFVCKVRTYAWATSECSLS